MRKIGSRARGRARAAGGGDWLVKGRVVAMAMVMEDFSLSRRRVSGAEEFFSLGARTSLRCEPLREYVRSISSPFPSSSQTALPARDTDP